MIELLIAFWAGGMLSVAPAVYEEWKDNLLPWDDAIMAVYLWPVCLVVWAYREWWR